METKHTRGGLARAASLTPEQRSDIARTAAEKRWQDRDGTHELLPRETHTGALKIGDRDIPCSVLNNGIRVFSTRGIHRIMGSTRRGGKKEPEPGGALLPSFLASPSIKSLIPNDLMVALISPIQYRPKHGGRTAFGYNATLLPQICEVILDAEKNEAIKQNQKRIVDAAGILIRAFARVGVIALVDEATGYQEDRARDELNRILEAYISKELLPWTERFPNGFFKQIYRLHGWEYREGSARGPRYIGKIINRTIYEPMPPGVLDELRRINPKMESGYRKYQHHRFLTPDTGNPHLDKQIVAVTTLMRVSDNKEKFWEMFDRAFPKMPPKKRGGVPQQMRLFYDEPEPLDLESRDVKA